MTLTWPEPPPTVDVPPEGGVHVWAASLEPPAAVLSRYEASLSGDEVERADRFKFDDDRRHFVAGRGWLRRMLGRYTGRTPSALSFGYGENGKPFLSAHGSPSPESSADPPLAFNLSHSGTCALLAVTAGVMVGVDVEHVRPLDDAVDIAERFFSEDEVRRFQQLSGDAVPQGFFNAWTRKEAFLKAVGTGLSLPLHAFDVTLTPGEPARLLALRADAWTGYPWTLQALAPAEDYAAALAVATDAPTVTCYRFEHEEE
jgi:4'-phosphopantetheinyl transferase